MSDFYYKYRNLFEDGNDIPYTHILNIYGKAKQPNDITSIFEIQNKNTFTNLNSNNPIIKPDLSNKQLNFLQNSPQKEEKSFKIPQKAYRNEDIYDMFYKEKNNKNEEKMNFQREILNLNRPNSMKESYKVSDDLKENEKKPKLFKNDIKKTTLERMGQQVLNQINTIDEKDYEKPKENYSNDQKEIKYIPNPNKYLEESKNKNIYDNFNQRLEHLDKMKKKYELQKNFDEKKMITKYSDPIHVYNDDLDRYKKALERRVVAAKNIIRKEKLRKLLKEEQTI